MRTWVGYGTLTFFLTFFLWGTGTILTVYIVSYLSLLVQPQGDKDLKREVAAAFNIPRVAVLGIRSRMFFGLCGSGSISQRYGCGSFPFL
jgi:hypothetical protein